MEMGEQYGLPDLRQLMGGGRSLFPGVSQGAEQLHSNRDLTARQHYEMMMMGAGHCQVNDEAMLPLAVVDFHPHHHDHSTTSTTSAPEASASVSALCVGGGGGGGGGLEREACIGGGCDGGGNGRWPRQETLTLLEIRSRLDPKFKEANQKGPLWDEVSRIMGEEHGYQRSGKKCREKFENLYKYYKKTKESKVGRQDGKHYRFFRQLEALYGSGERETPTTPPPLPPPPQLLLNQVVLQEAPQTQQIKNCDSLTLSSSSDFDTSSSEENNNQSHKRGRRKSWKAKIRDFVDSQMRKLVAIQEAWLEKMLKTLERKEQERMTREEEWRKEETGRLAREYKFWAQERAWVEARDAALMEALHKFTGREPKASSSSPEDNSEDNKRRKENSSRGSFHNHLHLPSDAPSSSNPNACTAVHDSTF